MCRWYRAIPSALAVLFLVFASPLAAQEEADGPVPLGAAAWEINLNAGITDDIPEFEPTGNITLVPDWRIGTHIGYTSASNLFVQTDFAYSPMELSGVTGGRSNTNAIFWDLSVGKNWQTGEKLQWFVAGGVGLGIYSPDEVDTSSGVTFNGGVGLRYFFQPTWALRTDLRYHVDPNGMGLPGELGLASLTSGISYFPGGMADADGDGVADEKDECSGTPAGVQVDMDGCAIDSDGDGVADYEDACADTQPGAEVDSEGCATDGDGDGVVDGIDQCSGTPSGAKVDRRGCPSDSDGDGVYDGIDRCSGTPRGADVNRRGCPSDGDGDDVLDGIDRCPDTPEGVVVDDRGCAKVETQRELIETGKVVLPNVNFASGSAQITDESTSILDHVGEALSLMPADARFEIGGHTDSQGPASYNQRLSEQRAQSVVDYLVENFDLSADRFDAQGYGEENPVASNETAEGRSQNRRVEISLLPEG